MSLLEKKNPFYPSVLLKYGIIVESIEFDYDLYPKPQMAKTPNGLYMGYCLHIDNEFLNEEGELKKNLKIDWKKNKNFKKYKNKNKAKYFIFEINNKKIYVITYSSYSDKDIIKSFQQFDDWKLCDDN